MIGIFCLGGIAYYDYFYIYQRNQNLWSTLFLSQTQAISSFSELLAVFRSFWHWKFEYLNFAQWLLVILGLISFLRSIRDKNKDRLLVLIIIALGYLGFIVLFGKQFIYHDYYALATFGPGLVYLMILGLKILSERPNKGISTLILFVLALVSFSVGSSHYFERMNEYVVMGNQQYRHDFKWLKDIDETTDLYLNDTSKVFVIYEAEPNLALVYLHKKGIVFNREEMGREESNFYYWLDRRKPGFILCRNANLEMFKKEHTVFIEDTDVAFQNSDFTLFEVNGH
ncbi:hypothetical protein GYB22_02705 [bacterium]|nr:hypothetical protein [bacterium]